MSKYEKIAIAIAFAASTAPVQARYLQVDPIAYDDNINLYVYVGNDPVGLVDPTGQRAVAAGNMIYILPDTPGVPSVAIPNTVGAQGFGPRDAHFHIYRVSSRGGIDGGAIGAGFRNNPTPGQDNPASPSGTRNDVGQIHPFDGGHNNVRSFSVPSPDRSRFTDITINYTIPGEHALNEGFVMGYGERNADGTVTMHHYGEGDAALQNPALGRLWGPQARRTWLRVQQQIRRRITNESRRSACHRQAGSCGTDLEIWD